MGQAASVAKVGAAQVLGGAARKGASKLVKGVKSGWGSIVKGSKSLGQKIMKGSKEAWYQAKSFPAAVRSALKADKKAGQQADKLKTFLSAEVKGGRLDPASAKSMIGSGLRPISKRVSEAMGHIGKKMQHAKGVSRIVGKGRLDKGHRLSTKFQKLGDKAVKVADDKAAKKIADELAKANAAWQKMGMFGKGMDVMKRGIAGAGTKALGAGKAVGGKVGEIAKKGGKKTVDVVKEAAKDQLVGRTIMYTGGLLGGGAVTGLGSYAGTEMAK